MMPLGEMLKLYRQKHRLGVRAMAELLGVSHATVSRIERGYGCDGNSLVKIVNWMFKHD
jgi:predicted transcriptional regulator